jgi:16S rRNA (cytidine1402-2'-O)-methyltransferase
MAGTLFVVATPIGNLEDLTFRALRTLREVDVIAAEDTRRTSRLLAHYAVRKPLISLREHNEARETPRLLARIEAGESVALVSDAGTPTIADPGARLVRTAHERGLHVVPIPGPSAVVAALSASGFSGDQFVFLGFPPSSGAARDQWFHDLGKEKRVAVFFEAPHRIARTLKDLVDSVKRPIVIGRELTKRHEQLVLLPINGELVNLPSIGEFCIVVDSLGHDVAKTIDMKEIIDMFGHLTHHAAIGEDLANRLLSLHFDIPVSHVRKLVKKARIEAKQRPNPPTLT